MKKIVCFFKGHEHNYGCNKNVYKCLYCKSEYMQRRKDRDLIERWIGVFLKRLLKEFSIILCSVAFLSFIVWTVYYHIVYLKKEPDIIGVFIFGGASIIIIYRSISVLLNYKEWNEYKYHL